MIERYLKLKEDYNNFVIIIKSGVFYISFSNDAKILSYLLGYKIKESSDNFMVGFPTSSINKVTNKLEELKLAYVIVKDNETYVSKHNSVTFDKYEKIVSKSNNIYELDNRINNILDKLNNLKRTNNIVDILDKIEEII